MLPDWYLVGLTVGVFAVGLVGLTMRRRLPMTVAELKAKLVDTIKTTKVTPAAGEMPGPIDAAGAVEVTTPNGVHFKLALSFETGSAAEPAPKP